MPADVLAHLVFVFVSSCPEPWGGSEELWSQAALQLAQAGHRVHVAKTNVDYPHPRIQALLTAGCTVTDLYRLPPLAARLRNRLLPVRWQSTTTQRGQQVLKQELAARQPQLTIVAQGNNFDGVAFAEVCRQAGYAYVLVAQKAVQFLFPYDWERPAIQAAYQAAKACFFVSNHNLALTRQQTGMPLPQAVVVPQAINPQVMRAFTEPALPMPAPEGVFRLACVARLDLFDKGQDLLLTVLAQPAWRSRPIQVTLFGSGPHREGIDQLIQFLNLNGRVRLGGHVANPAAIWETHQALVLPSRSEGLPLALIEAMLCGRPAIATDAGGTAELLVDGVTGFLAASASVAALDEAMERAWARRHQWGRIGEVAAQHVRATVPGNGAALFCRQLLSLADISIANPPACV